MISLASTEEEIKDIVKLADKIWKEHFYDIVGKAQIDYMLEKFQTFEIVKKQIKEENYRYYSILFDKKLVGYISFKIKGDSIFLSKFYVDKNYRGKGLGREAIDFIFNFGKELKLKKVYLTVNKNNINSIKIYEKLGFENIEELITDIGNGFVMDDYKFEKKIWF